MRSVSISTVVHVRLTSPSPTPIAPHQFLSAKTGTKRIDWTPQESRRCRTGSSASRLLMNCTFPCARRLGTEGEPPALTGCQRLRVSIIGAVPGAFHIWCMKRAKFGAPLFAYKWAQLTPIDRPINSSTFGIEWSNSRPPQNFGRARSNGLQNSIASVQLTLCFVSFGDLVLEVGSQ